MPNVTLDKKTHDSLRLVAAALGVTESNAVGELLRRLADSTPSGNDGGVPIHVVYKGVRTEARFTPATGVVEVVVGPLAGKRFTSPSRAAIEVVRAINPSVSPNRNGWGFWLVTGTGQALHTIRQR